MPFGNQRWRRIGTRGPRQGLFGKDERTKRRALVWRPPSSGFRPASCVLWYRLVKPESECKGDVALRYAGKRLRQWLCAKHKMSWPATGKFPETSLYDKFGLVRLPERTQSFSCHTDMEA